jgi:hypothetical protein
MKTMLLLIFLSFISSAQASYFSLHCSNAKRTVSWEGGHNSNTIRFKTSEIEDDEFTLPLFSVKIDFLSDTTIKEEGNPTCTHNGYHRVYAGKVKISPVEYSPQLFAVLDSAETMETEVICHYTENGLAPCPEEIK